MQAIETVGIIGFGRFGQLLARLLVPRFKKVLVFDVQDHKSEAESSACEWVDLTNLMQADAIFLAVPISTYVDVLRTIAEHTRVGQVCIDVASVKSQVRDWMLELLPEHVQVLNTHPMFGPDSYDHDPDLKLVYHPTRLSTDLDAFWRCEFQHWGCHLIEVTPEEHDHLAARSQGLTHFVGRVMQEMGVQSTELDTHGFRQVHHVVEQTCQDTDELFRDLQNFNPNTPDMLHAFREAVDTIEGNLFHRDRRNLRIGYQGVPGSFSDQASRIFCERQDIGQEYLIPCISSAGVLEALNRYQVDIGIVAMENARGGVVHESIHALAAGRCRIAEMYHMQVSQCLMTLDDIEFESIREIHSHLQALKQCSSYLTDRFEQQRHVQADDTALAAKLLSEGELPIGTAVIAPARAAELYGLKIQAKNIQDLEDNKTLFLALIRPGSGIQLHPRSQEAQV